MQQFKMGLSKHRRHRRHLREKALEPLMAVSQWHILEAFDTESPSAGTLS